MKKWIRLVLSMSIVSFLVVSLHASYTDQVSLETSLAEKAQHILDTMYGKFQFAVTAKVDIGNESWAVKYTGRANVKTAKKAEDSHGGPDYQILPGYSAIRNLAPDEQSALPYNSEISKIPPRIRRITLDIVASKDIPKKDVRNAEKILVKLLDMDSSRGDKVNFQFESFPVAAKAKAAAEGAANAEHPTSGNDVLMSVALGLMGVFMLIYILMQNRLVKKLGGLAAAGGGGGSSAPAPAHHESESEHHVAAGAAGPAMHRYFDFVTESNVTTLISAMKREGLAPENVGMVVSYLSPVLASKVLSAYSVADQSTIIAGIVDEKVLDKSAIEGIEGKIKERLECMVGGEEILSGVLSQLGNESKKGILQALQKDPASYQKARKNVLLFDDLKALSDDEMKLVVSDTNLDMLSTAMAGAEKGTQDKIQNNMSAAAKAMLKQFMELKGSHLSKGEIEMAQVYVLDLVSRLDQEGKIKLRQKIMGANKAAASAAPATAKAAG